MSANDPRLEFRPGPEVRLRLERLRDQIAARTGHKVTMSELIKSIIDHYLVLIDRGRG